jgi:predicted enzyme related to lactoylglutathione lyase
MNHPVVWFEVLGDDSSKLIAFYRELFGWKIDAPNPAVYGIIEKQAGGIAGGIGSKAAHESHPSVTFYVSTPDVARSLETATKLGGEVVRGRTPLSGGPVIGLFRDPEGNVIGLVENEA